MAYEKNNMRPGTSSYRNNSRSGQSPKRTSGNDNQQPQNDWTSRNIGAVWTNKNGKHFGSIDVDALLKALDEGLVQLDSKTSRPRILLTVNATKQDDRAPDFRLYFVPSSDGNNGPQQRQQSQHRPQPRQSTGSRSQNYQRPTRSQSESPVDDVQDDQSNNYDDDHQNASEPLFPDDEGDQNPRRAGF